MGRLVSVQLFVRQRIVQGLTRELEGIKVCNGYMTQPFVTQDPREIVGNESPYMLLVIPGNESVIEVGISGCHDMECEVSIYGYAQVKDGNPIMEINQLLQDVRNVVHQNVGLLADFADRGLAFRFGDLETDEGVLAHSGIAAFVQTCHFGYKNHDQW